ncbi:NYN domain-containing protein [Flavobacterium sp.]|uniref:NYN domain-containing protein n=1 Tax=Flavobacterium sp. TaxID=239 RepID=UPI002FDDA16C
MRTVFYIDGFNFYYGLRNIKKADADWQNYYWIDIVALCEEFINPGDNLVKVKYFTSPPLNNGKKSRQSALFKANDLINGARFEIIRGKYYNKTLHCGATCGETYTMPEEKRTDVNISVNLIGDCALGLVDKIVLITADSDLVPPIEFIKTHFPQIEIKIIFPPSSYSYDLKDVAKKKKVIRMEHNKFRFKNCVMDDEVFNGAKTDSAVIPPKWKPAP